MPTYVTKQRTVKAFAINVDAWPAWFGQAVTNGLVRVHPERGLQIDTAAGPVQACIGDVVIKDGTNLVVMSAADFAATYEEQA